MNSVLADDLGKRVLVIDTSNEVCTPGHLFEEVLTIPLMQIAGDGDVPHHCIGRARRLQIKDRKFQAQVMIEAVQVSAVPALKYLRRLTHFQ
jgi:stage III sporulation protein SpoIIIAA